jgi:hypothetical protein
VLRGRCGRTLRCFRTRFAGARLPGGKNLVLSSGSPIGAAQTQADKSGNAAAPLVGFSNTPKWKAAHEERLSLFLVSPGPHGLRGVCASTSGFAIYLRI